MVFFHEKDSSITLAVLMLLSAVPMAMAADVDVSEGTTIKLVGSQEETGESYTVTVPATLAPGESGTVTASGSWSSKQTLKVTAPNSVTLSYGEQTMDVGITFAGIEQVGSDTAASSTTAIVSVADVSVLFGTWTGTLNYTVELDDNRITFTIDDTEYQAEKGMTWGEWVESEYNTVGAYISSSSVYKAVGTDRFFVETGVVSVKASDVIDPSIDDYCWTKSYPITEK